MGTMEIVFDEPFHEFFVQGNQVGKEISFLKEFFLERTVKTFNGSMLFWAMGIGKIMRDILSVKLLLEFSKEFRSIVSVNIEHFVWKDVLEFFQKINATHGGISRIHIGKGNFRHRINRGFDVIGLAVPVHDDGIHFDVFTGFPMHYKVFNPLFLSPAPYMAPRFFPGTIEHMVSADNPSNSTRRDVLIEQVLYFFFSIHGKEFAESLDLLNEDRRSSRDPHLAGTSRGIFQAFEASFRKAGLPFPKTALRDPEITAGERCVLHLGIVIKPSKPSLG